MVAKLRKTPNENGRTPIVCGADIELGNFVRGLDQRGGTGRGASRLLLREIQGYPGPKATALRVCECARCRSARKAVLAGTRVEASEGLGLALFDPRDWGRKFLPTNGGCAYIDMDHLELCLPEVTSAFDHVSAWHAMLAIARKAMLAANAKLPPDQSLQLLVNNSDGFGHSYGSHLNFLVTRRTWDNLFQRKMHYLLWLAAFQASSIVFSGQGKVGSENDAPHVNYQISQRADFFEQLVSIQTTHNRPLVNSRNESLCGPGGPKSGGDLARLHVIFFDNTLSHTACLLKVGVMQIVIAMIEAERVNLDLLLDDPVDAVHRWSHDPTLETRAHLAAGPDVTAVELQLLFLEEARTFVEDGGCEGIVPRASEIIELWADTLQKLWRRDWASLEGRLDWVLKLRLLEGVIAERRGLDWSSIELKHLDHAYANLDLNEGLYWACERSNRVERIASEEEIAFFETNPPNDTRAWTRAMLLRAVEPAAIIDVDWHQMEFAFRDQENRGQRLSLKMGHPLAFNRTETEAVIAKSQTLEGLLKRLGSGARVENSITRHPKRGERLPTINERGRRGARKRARTHTSNASQGTHK